MQYNPEYDTIQKTLTLKWKTVSENILLNRCVYCNSTNDLRDEHTYPLAIWGIDKLLNGSCHNCEKSTQSFEQRVFRDMLGRAREFLNSPTRKARKNGKRTGKINMMGEDGISIESPLHCVHQFMLIPFGNFIPRGISGRLKSKGHISRKIQVVSLNDGQDPIFSGRWGPSIKVSPIDFERAVAKIAYCEYIRLYDSTYHSQRVSDFILSGRGDSSAIVGGCDGHDPNNHLHTLDFYALQQRKGRYTSYSILARLRLFSAWHTPTHLIWLGDVQKPPAILPLVQHWDRNFFTNPSSPTPA